MDIEFIRGKCGVRYGDRQRIALASGIRVAVIVAVEVVAVEYI